MQQAIQTRYFGPSNSRGSRVKATARKRENDLPEIALTDSWNHASSMEENHCRVAKLLAAKMGWSGLYVGGGSPENSGYVFVCIGRVDPLLIDPIMRRGVEGRDWFQVPVTDR